MNSVGYLRLTTLRITIDLIISDQTLKRMKNVLVMVKYSILNTGYLRYLWLSKILLSAKETMN